MGYDTDFEGEFELNAPLTSAHYAYLQAFSRSRRMKRDIIKVTLLQDHLREATGLPVGTEGEFYVGGDEESESILNYNEPPSTQPGLWCHWVPSEDAESIEWDGRGKFYDYVEWLTYIIENFLTPWGYTLNGEVEWQGSDISDIGIIVVKDNEVSTKIFTIKEDDGFSNEEKIALFEIAHMALADAELFDLAAERMDLSDAEMKDLSYKLDEYMDSVN